MPEPQLQVYSSQEYQGKSKLGILCILRAMCSKLVPQEFEKLKGRLAHTPFLFIPLLVKRGELDYNLNETVNKCLQYLGQQCEHLLICDHFPKLEGEITKKWIEQPNFKLPGIVISKTPSNFEKPFHQVLSPTPLMFHTGGFSPWVHHPESSFQEMLFRAKKRGIPLHVEQSSVDQNDVSGFYREASESLKEKEQEHKNQVYAYQNHLMLKRPDFLIIGAQKSGSTSLIRNISLHPEIHVPEVTVGSQKFREIHFFDSEKYHTLGEKWYLSLFYHPKKKCAGEKTPEYFISHKCHELIHQLLPNTKLFLALRNPIDRAYSAVQHVRRLNASWGPQELKNGTSEEAFDLLSTKLIDHSIVTYGHYAEHLESLFKYYSKDQLNVFINERMERDHDLIYEEIFNVLGVNSKIKIPHKKHFVGNYEDTRTTKSLETLKEYYKPHNERLFNLLGYNIPEWE